MNYLSVFCIGNRANEKFNNSFFYNVYKKYMIYAAKWGDETCKEICIVNGYDIDRIPE